MLAALGKKWVCGWNGRAGLWGEAESRAGSHGLIPCILRATKSFFVPMEVGVTFLSLSKQSSN